MRWDGLKFLLYFEHFYTFNTCLHFSNWSGVQYIMPDAYDQDGGVDQEKRFSVVVDPKM